MAVDGRYEGLFLFRESLAPRAAAAIQQLQQAGIATVLVSGDRADAAAALAVAAGIPVAHSGIQPAGKADLIRRLQQEGHRVAMVGDGSNDAPALAVADVSFAMGTGTDVAISTSDVVILDGDLTGVLWFLRYAHQVTRVIKANLVWCFLYNALGLPAAALGLLRPEFACLAMAASSLSVLGHSLRLRRARFHA
jgi:Cu+-exporting ATPase